MAPWHLHPPAAARLSECTSHGQMPRNPRAGASGSCRPEGGQHGGRAPSSQPSAAPARPTLPAAWNGSFPLVVPAARSVPDQLSTGGPASSCLSPSEKPPTHHLTLCTTPHHLPSRPALRPPPLCLVLVPPASLHGLEAWWQHLPRNSLSLCTHPSPVATALLLRSGDAPVSLAQVSPNLAAPQTRALLSVPPGVPQSSADTVCHLLALSTELATAKLTDRPQRTEGREGSRLPASGPRGLLHPRRSPLPLVANQLVCWLVNGR